MWLLRLKVRFFLSLFMFVRLLVLWVVVSCLRVVFVFVIYV